MEALDSARTDHLDAVENELGVEAIAIVSLVAADDAFSSVKGGGAGIGKTKRGRGVKIKAIVDKEGLPLAVSTHAANHHEVTLVQLSFQFYMIEAKPEKLIGDKAYDSDDLDLFLARKGIALIEPASLQSAPRPQTPLSVRWIVERFFTRIQYKRRLLVRWEFNPANFLGFVQLASIYILLNRF